MEKAKSETGCCDSCASDIKAIKQALYLLLKDKMDDEMYDANHVQKEEYDGCGCSTIARIKDPEQVKAVKKKYLPILKVLKR